MRVTIIRDDNTVLVDGEAHAVDCSGLPIDFHALQWDGASGEIEYRMIVCSHCNTRSKKPNLFVNDMTPYLAYVDAWAKAKKAAIEAQTERDAIAARQAATIQEEKAQADAAG